MPAEEQLKELLDCTNFQETRVGGLRIIGIDNGTDDVREDCLDRLKKADREGEPILLAMHIPMTTDQNRAFLTFHVEPYFLFDNKDASECVAALCRWLREGAKNVVAICAGHLHFETVTDFRPCRLHYVAS